MFRRGTLFSNLFLFLAGKTPEPQFSFLVCSPVNELCHVSGAIQDLLTVYQFCRFIFMLNFNHTEKFIQRGLECNSL